MLIVVVAKDGVDDGGGGRPFTGGKGYFCRQW